MIYCVMFRGKSEMEKSEPSRTGSRYNGNGNAYFHNAYFLRVVGSLLRDCTFRGRCGLRPNIIEKKPLKSAPSRRELP